MAPSLHRESGYYFSNLHFSGRAHTSAAAMRTVANGFRLTGIWPPHRNIFLEADFLPAAMTHIALMRSHTEPCD
jgi:hypothetical protein